MVSVMMKALASMTPFRRPIIPQSWSRFGPRSCYSRLKSASIIILWSARCLILSIHGLQHLRPIAIKFSNHQIAFNAKDMRSGYVSCMHPFVTGKHQMRQHRYARSHFRNGDACLRRHTSSLSEKSENSAKGEAESAGSASTQLDMTNLYQEWTLEQDQALLEAYERDKRSTIELAVLLGRGLGGVQARLSKLRDVKSAAYERLFVQTKKDNRKSLQSLVEEGKEGNDTTESKKKLVPAGQVLRRIQWGYGLNGSDFSILHYDRVEDTILESPFDAPNESIKGRETRFVDALPEHRILAIKYRERIVWDRRARIDLVFGGENHDDDDSGDGIAHVVATYDEWKRQHDAETELAQQRWAQISTRVGQVLGFELYAELEILVESLENKIEKRKESLLNPRDQSNSGSIPPISKSQVEGFVENALDLLRDIRQDPERSLDPTLIPTSDYNALDLLSEWIVLMPTMEENLKPTILREISEWMDELTGKRKSPALPKNRPLPEIDEADLEETFIRGSGPGGQKINKTSNCVDLLHRPTQLRVQCQETRSLPQNRKIARRRLREKLDEYLNGRQSKKQMDEQLASERKAKAKSRSRAKHKRIKMEQQQQQEQPDQQVES